MLKKRCGDVGQVLSLSLNRTIQSLHDKTKHTVQRMSRTIFLAEDDVDDQEFLEDALRSLDPHIRLVSFTSGARFIQHLEKTADDQLPCLIILDYNIPEINGAEILKYLGGNSRYRDIHKIIWSTSNSSLYVKTCMDLGAKDYVIKPSSIAGIREIAEKILGWCKVS